jgi:hypothetical protein
MGRVGTLRGRLKSKRAMKRNALTLALAAVAFAACGSEEPRAPSVVPDPVPNEQALELIRSCRVSLIEGSHSGEMHIYLQSGRRVRVENPNGVWEAAEESSQDCPGMEFATE